MFDVVYKHMDTLSRCIKSATYFGTGVFTVYRAYDEVTEHMSSLLTLAMCLLFAISLTLTAFYTLTEDQQRQPG